MNTRRMTERITFFQKVAGQNEDGEVVNNDRQELFSCWTEVQKTSVRDFKTNSDHAHKDTKIFLIRFHPNPPFDTTSFIDFRGMVYQVEAIEADERSRDYVMVRGVRVS